MNILAIDLGKFNSMTCFFNSGTSEYRFQLAKTDRRYLRTLLKSEPIDLVVMEACSCSGWVSDLCHELRLKTLVCSTNEEAWRWRNVKCKTDKNDALKLARLAALGQLKATHVPSKETREYRALIKYRKQLVGQENRITNSIRALFVRRGIAISRGKRTWCTGREQLEAYRWPIAHFDTTSGRGSLTSESMAAKKFAARKRPWRWPAGSWWWPGPCCATAAITTRRNCCAMCHLSRLRERSPRSGG